MQWWPINCNTSSNCLSPFACRHLWSQRKRTLTAGSIFNKQAASISEQVGGCIRMFSTRFLAEPMLWSFKYHPAPSTNTSLMKKQESKKCFMYESQTKSIVITTVRERGWSTGALCRSLHRAREKKHGWEVISVETGQNIDVSDLCHVHHNRKHLLQLQHSSLVTFVTWIECESTFQLWKPSLWWFTFSREGCTKFRREVSRPLSCGNICTNCLISEEQTPSCCFTDHLVLGRW